MRASVSLPTTLRRRTLLSTVLLAATSGCSRLQFGETAELVGTFGHSADRRLIPTQPALSDPPASWVTHTTDPNRADELFPWEELFERYGDAAPYSQPYTNFEPGERCVVFVAFHSPDEELQSFEQSDAGMFDTGEISLQSLTFPEIDIPRYQYVGAAWELEDVDVPEEFTLRFESD